MNERNCYDVLSHNFRTFLLMLKKFYMRGYLNAYQTTSNLIRSCCSRSVTLLTSLHICGATSTLLAEYLSSKVKQNFVGEDFYADFLVRKPFIRPTTNCDNLYSIF